jgi:hypothetical protein
MMVVRKVVTRNDNERSGASAGLFTLTVHPKYLPGILRFCEHNCAANRKDSLSSGSLHLTEKTV